MSDGYTILALDEIEPVPYHQREGQKILTIQRLLDFRDAIGGRIGEAHGPSGWTSFVVADALRREGRMDEARAAIREPIEQFPDAWHAPYNAACFEAIAGEPDNAFAYLQQALRIDAQAVKGYAPQDPDLDSLHDDARWKKLVG